MVLVLVLELESDDDDDDEVDEVVIVCDVDKVDVVLLDFVDAELLLRELGVGGALVVDASCILDNDSLTCLEDC